MREIRVLAYYKKVTTETWVSIGEYTLREILEREISFDMTRIGFVLSTGLKDKNGKEIFEGDVVAIDGGAEPYKTAVFFADGCFCVKVRENDCELKYYINMEFCEAEIIGNIYQQPELLGDRMTPREVKP